MNSDGSEITQVIKNFGLNPIWKQSGNNIQLNRLDYKTIVCTA